MFASSTGLGPLQAIASALENAGPAQPLSQNDAMMMTLRGLTRAGGRGSAPARRAPAQQTRSPEEIRQLLDQFRQRMAQGRPAGPVAGGAPQPGGPVRQPQNQTQQGQGGIAGLLQGLQSLMQQRGQGAQAGAEAGVASDDVLARRRAQRQRMAQSMQSLPRGR